MNPTVALKRRIRREINRRGFEIRRDPLLNVGQKRARLMQRLGIRSVLDVGANAGQYATHLRSAGYDGLVVSFEPLPDAYADCERTHGGDARWTGHHVALGGEDAELTFYVSADSVCSSPLAATAALTGPLPGSVGVGQIRVPMRRLDSLVEGVAGPMMLKIDTQGFEHAVLDGASETLARVDLLEIEMALVELYEGGSTVYDLLPRLREAGFWAVSMENGFVDPPSQQTLDVDVLLVSERGCSAATTRR